MPYITPEDRAPLDAHVEYLAGHIKSPGELNYVITRLLVLCILSADKTPRYQHLSRWLGAVQDASREFYRRVMTPYEAVMCKVNGDVYGDLLKRMGVG